MNYYCGMQFCLVNSSKIVGMQQRLVIYLMLRMCSWDKLFDDPVNYIYGESDYYIYGYLFITLMVNHLLHLWLKFWYS